MAVMVKKSVSVMPVMPAYDRTVRPQMKALRVVAYCRISALMEQQEGSYEAQVGYYMEKIKSNPNWKLAGIYTDDEKSTAPTRKRADFQATIDDRMAGKIDIIITKSVSRFARNTVDSLTHIRELEGKNIMVCFEEKGINTLEGDSELLITILSNRAQEGNRNISESCHWGIVKRLEDEKVIISHNKLMRYTRDRDGNLIIVPRKTEVVRRIFRFFLEGNSSYRIKQILEVDGIRTTAGNTVWQATVIDKMLANERYMGDTLLQRTYTMGFLTKEKVMNRGVAPQYYVEDDHEPVIPKELFHWVQEEKARRTSIYRADAKKKNIEIKGKYSSKYVLSSIMACAKCGQPYQKQIWSKYGTKWAIQRYDNRLKHGSKRCKHSPTLREEVLHEAIMTTVNDVVEDQGEFVQAFRENVIRIIGSYSAAAKPTEYDSQIGEFQKRMMKLIEDSAKAESVDEVFDKEYRIVADEIKELKKKKTRVIQEGQLAESYDQRTQNIESYMRKTNYLKKESDDDLVRRLLWAVRVIDESRMEIQFQSGIVMI